MYVCGVLLTLTKRINMSYKSTRMSSLPEDIRKLALLRRTTPDVEDLSRAFIWDRTPEGRVFWEAVNNLDFTKARNIFMGNYEPALYAPTCKAPLHQHLLGRKIRGFSFISGTNGIGYYEEIRGKYLGLVGEITLVWKDFVRVRFENGVDLPYPLPEVEKYLVDCDAPDDHDTDAVSDDKSRVREFDTGSKRDADFDKPLVNHLDPYLRLRFGYLLRAGANKYDKGNWRKGQPTETALESLHRHLAKFELNLQEGLEQDEDHLSAIIFNVMLIMKNEEKDGILVDHYFGTTK